MKEISHRLTSLSGLPPKKTLSGPVESAPRESYQPASAEAEWLQKPSFDRAAEEPRRSNRRTLGVGQKVALITAGLAAGAGAVGLATAHPGATNPSVQLSQKDAQKALNNFQYLDQLVRSQGGSLKSDPQTLLGRVFHHQTEVDASQALSALSQGYTVHLYPSGESQEGIPIRSVQDLKQITSVARQQVAEQHFKQGLENLKDGLRDLGRTIEQEIGDIFR